MDAPLIIKQQGHHPSVAGNSQTQKPPSNSLKTRHPTKVVHALKCTAFLSSMKSDLCVPDHQSHHHQITGDVIISAPPRIFQLAMRVISHTIQLFLPVR